jgi:hypothetical protein
MFPADVVTRHLNWADITDQKWRHIAWRVVLWGCNLFHTLFALYNIDPKGN